MTDSHAIHPDVAAGATTGRLDRAAVQCDRLIRYLESKNNVLLLTTSTRYRKHRWDVPKSTQLAQRIKAHLKAKRKHVTLIDVAGLTIHTCEGNISAKRGNSCGVTDATLRDKRKNPTGLHRCWASINNADDQLYKITRDLFRSQVVIFFVSVRWGQTNSVYQRLLERLSWIENRVTTLGEKPIAQLKKLEAGVVLFGQNWNDAAVLKVQQQNFRWFGWKAPTPLSFCWQYTGNATDESAESYLSAVAEFEELVQILPPSRDP